MSTHNLHNLQSHDESSSGYRIGTVSRLAGVPVSTLRMWEVRYAAFTPGKTGGQHRVYGDDDVLRARMLRQLTESGHGIGRIARLPSDELQRLLTSSRMAEVAPPDAADPLGIVVLGAALATRLQSAKWIRHMRGTVFDIRAVFEDVEDFASDEGLAALRGANVLVARFNALPAAAVLQLTQLKASGALRHAVVLYNFAARPALDALREAGFLLRREPVDDAELAELLRSVTWTSRGEDPRAAAIPGRRFADDDLARIAASPTQMLCECPRHLADIIGQLASFEDYSANCLNDSAEDARVHAHLRSVAGSARAMFEGALALVIEHDRRRERD